MPLGGFLQRYVMREKPVSAAPRPDASPVLVPVASGETTSQWQCGVARLDDQSKALFQAIRRYQTAFRAGAGSEATEEALAFLEDHADGHLVLEEVYLERIGFPGLAEHRQGHRAFQHQIHAFRDRVADKDPSVGLELSQLLYAWMKEHVLREDVIWCEHARASRRHRQG
jgi:hemerythrin-like metal-binding protein